MSENGHEHRRQNREVEYPSEKLEAHLGLESYFLELIDQDKMPDFDTLPQSFTTGAFDTYASWVAALTAKDSEHRERSSFIFFNPDKDRFVFPPNPLIGEEMSATTLLTRVPEKNYPLIRVHSHPDSTAFSTTDFKRLLSNTGLWLNQNDSLAELVGTQSGNYLLLSTRQAQFHPDEEIENLMGFLNANIFNTRNNRTAQQLTIMQGLGKSEEEAATLIAELKKKEQNLLGSDFTTLAATINFTALLASTYLFGFYYSTGNGLFEKHNPERVVELKKQADQLFYEMLEPM